MDDDDFDRTDVQAIEAGRATQRLLEGRALASGLTLLEASMHLPESQRAQLVTKRRQT